MHNLETQAGLRPPLKNAFCRVLLNGNKSGWQHLYHPITTKLHSVIS